MHAGTGFETPEPPSFMRGFVVQLTYTEKETPAGRLHPFDVDASAFDLSYREWTIVSFSSGISEAKDTVKESLDAGWRVRHIPGVAEKVGDDWQLHTLH